MSKQNLEIGNIDRDLRIDESALDIEWLNQPRIFMRYAMAAAEAERVAKRAKEKVKTIRSELIREVAKSPQETTGKAKPTAQDTEAYYRVHEDYIEAKEELTEAEFENSLLWNAVSAFHQRKLCLENLVRLNGQQYFAGPSVPRDLAQEVRNKEATLERQQKMADQKVKQVMSRRRKK